MDLKTLENLPSNQKILLLGVGTEIIQFLEWLDSVVKFDLKRVYLADKKDVTSIDNFTLTQFAGCYFNDNYLDAFENEHIKYIFKAPGIWSKSQELELFRAKNGSDSVLSSLVFFIQKFKSQIVGITGTKGKSTTSSLIQHFLVNAGYNSKYCGNTTGISPYQFWTIKDQELQPNQKFVIELSSFQLQDIGYSKISLETSVITNYYIDHLDQHGNVMEYWSSKDQIFVNNPENAFVIATDQVLEHSSNLSEIKNKIVVDKNIIDKINNLIQHNLLGDHNKSNLSQSLILTESLVCKTHNLDLILKNIEAKKDFYTKILTTFKPLAHRIELIRTIETPELTINFYDDGAATEPDAVAAAVLSTTQNDNQFLWLQLTGKDANSNLDNLISTLKKQHNQIFKIDFCGEIGGRIYENMYSKPIKNIKFKDLTTAQFDIFEIQIIEFIEFIEDKNLHQKPVLQIVLSPCGKSFDEFGNYLDRCNWWQSKVKSIQLNGN